MNASVKPHALDARVRVGFTDHPFGQVKVYGCTPGASIAEMIAEMPHLPPGFAEFGQVRINDVEVPRDHWARVRPKADTDVHPVIVTLHVPPGSSGTWRTVAQIAVLVAAIAVTVLVPGPLGQILGAGIALGGSLAIAALTPAPTLTDSVATSSATLATPVGNSLGNASSASLAGNVLAKNRPLPRSIGTNRIYPPLICQPLIYWDGKDEIAEAVFALAGPHQISSIRVGQTDVTQMPEVTVEVNDGTNPAAYQVALVQRQAFTETPSVEMGVHLVSKAAAAGGPVVLSPQASTNIPETRAFASRPGPDEIWISLQFGEGLYYTSDPAQQIVVPFRIQMRKRGDIGWLNLPELHVTWPEVKAVEQIVRLIWNTPAPPKASFPPPPANGGGGCVRAYWATPGQGVDVGLVTSGWQAATYFTSSGLQDVYSNHNPTSTVENVRMFANGAAVYLSGVDFPQTVGGQGVVWEIQITQGAAYRNSDFSEDFYTNSNGPLTTVYDYFNYYVEGGVLKQVWDLAGSRYKATVTRIASVWNQHPVQSADFATIAIQVKSRQLEALSCLASAYVPDWNGSAWTGRVVTSNPAPHLRQMLVDSAMNKSALPTSMIDDAQFVTWRQRCITKGYAANCVLEGQSVLDGANLIAAAGYARLRTSEKWGVVQDYDRSAEAPVQIFSARNMRGFRFQKGFPRRPDALRIQYRNAAADYADTQIEINDPAAGSINVLQEISYDSLTSTAAVQARAAFDIAQSKLRSNFYSAEVPIEAIVATRGDLVGVNHDILSDQQGAARIKSITRGAGRITQIVLDGTVPGPVSGFLGIAVRLTDFSIWIQATNITGSSEVNTITFSGSGPLDPGSSLLTADCLLASGKAGTEYKRMILFAVLPKQDFTAEVTLVDEAPTLPF